MNPEIMLNLLSIGASFAISERQDGSDIKTQIQHYELFAQNYYKTPMENLFIRTGLRFAYEALPQEDSPQWLSISEKTLRSGLELGFVYDVNFIPSLSMHSSLLRRTLELETNGAIVSSSRHYPLTEWLPSQAINIGLGLPIEGGRALIEPFYRWIWIGGDARQKAQWGVDASFAISWEK